MGPRILPETTVSKHNLPYPLQMPTKALSCKKEAICVQKRCCVLWAKAHLKWTVSKWKSVLWSDESKFYILVGNKGCHVLLAKEEGDLPACYQHSVQKPASLIVWGCIRYGQLACFGSHYECWKVYKGFRATYAPLCSYYIHTAAITTWLWSRRAWVLNWPAWSPALSLIENIWSIIKWKM